MKVLLVNGSPHHKGCTFTALQEIEKELQTQGIETEIFWIGIRPLSGCMGCNYCLEAGRCCMEDSVNLFLEKHNKLMALYLVHPFILHQLQAP